jgi:hypothetical protein
MIKAESKHMRRRAFLSGLGGCALAGGLGGCASSANSQSNAVEIKGVDTAPREYPGAFTVSVRKPLITKESTARIRIALENTSNRPRTFVFGHSPPFSGLRSEDGQLLLLDRTKQTGGEYEPVAPGCWVPEANSFDLIEPDVLNDVRLDPGEKVGRTVLVWGTDSQDCTLRGEYRFDSNEYRLPNGNSFTWGFSIEIQ